MNFDLRTVPFSRRGSTLAFSLLPERSAGTASSTAKPALWLRNIAHPFHREVFRLQVLEQGHPVPFECTAEPTLLELHSPAGIISVCFEDADRLRIEGQGAGLQLQVSDAQAVAIPGPGQAWQVNAFSTLRQYLLTPLHGTLNLQTEWSRGRCLQITASFLPDPLSNQFEAQIEQFQASWQPQAQQRTFSDCHRLVSEDFEGFRRAYPHTPAGFEAAEELAVYINWSCLVNPSGFWTRPAMLCSKNWMCGVWSWDNCFNALALCRQAPELAWDQFMLPFDHQQPSGQLPDQITDIYQIWNYVKPPVHGWALQKMLQANPWFETRLSEIYEPLSRWTTWWFTWRDLSGFGLPQYHHGNDSGWDNCTVFDEGAPLISADLAAYLIIQMEVLSWIAGRLGRLEQAASWKQQAKTLQRRMIQELWQGGRFVPRRVLAGGHSKALSLSASDSLFNFLPLVLGKRLPQRIRRPLIADLRRFLTPFGLASEHPASPSYEDEGYWRGPIWAAPNLLIADGLYQAGEKALALEIASRFYRLCRESGFSENYQARTGQPLSDPAYTWTAGIFLYFPQIFSAGEFQP